MDNKDKKNTKNFLWVIIIILVMIIILLLLRSCGASSLGENAPTNQSQDQVQTQGNFEIGGKREEPVVEEEPKDVEYITFSGFGKFEVSEKAPNVELCNPDGNSVDMIFTLSDKATGDVIARTGKVHSGEYVYVNVMEYYKTPGNYFVAVQIDTTNEDNVPMNGLSQEMEITVK